MTVTPTPAGSPAETRDDEKTRQIRKDTIAELAEARTAILSALSASPAERGVREAITDEAIARVAEAIDKAEVSYHLRLTKMVDDQSTYTLTYSDGEEHEFDDIDDGYAHIRQRKLRKQAENVIAALASTAAAAEKASVGDLLRRARLAGEAGDGALCLELADALAAAYLVNWSPPSSTPPDALAKERS